MEFLKLKEFEFLNNEKLEHLKNREVQNLLTNYFENQIQTDDLTDYQVRLLVSSLFYSGYVFKIDDESGLLYYEN